MTEAKVGFLFNAASSLQHAGDNNKSLTFLRSYYLMRCKEVTKGYGLPEKHFSAKARCLRCCVEWNTATATRVKAIKLSKKQRQRIRSLKVKKGNKEFVEKKNKVLCSNEIEQICSFCKQSTVTIAPKPEKYKESSKSANKRATKYVTDTTKNDQINASNVKTIQTTTSNKEKKKIKKNKVVNVYSGSTDVFSLNNKNNVLMSAKKEEPKVLAKNKKRKDKFAGLCQKAVLASAKMKDQNHKQNKLNLFLKPSL